MGDLRARLDPEDVGSGRLLLVSIGFGRKSMGFDGLWWFTWAQEAITVLVLLDEMVDDLPGALVQLNL